MLDGGVERAHVVAFGERRLKREIEDADIVPLVIGDRPFDPVDDGRGVGDPGVIGDFGVD